MVKRKSIRTRGKIQLSKYFQEFKKGDSISIIRERAVKSNFPDRFQGRTGVVEAKRGKAYLVNIKDKDKEKRFLVEPIHLKKIKTLKENDNK
jgi:large subunit ribosomal protein L21e